MEACECPHDAAMHAPVQDVGSAMCLAPDCDCDGTREQVAAMVAERLRLTPESQAERLVTLIRGVLSNKLPRTIEDMSRNLAAALVATYDLVER
jgi:hypothetical protein